MTPRQICLDGVLLLAVIVSSGCGGGGSATGPTTSLPPLEPEWTRWSLQAIPASSQVGVQLYPAHRPLPVDWCVFRSWPAEIIHVIAACEME